MQTAANEERPIGTGRTAVGVDAAPRGSRSAAAAAAWLGLDVVAEGTWFWAAPALVERHRPDVLFVGCDDPELCLQLVERIRSSGVATRVVVVSRCGRES